MKRKLLFAIVALLCSVATWAQKDITSTYITNATLSNGTTGWTVSNFNTPVRGNNTVGYATESYAGWDNLSVTSYSLTQSITLPAGNFRLVNYSFFRQGLNFDTNKEKSLAYLKAGGNQVAIKTLGSIDAAGYANSQAEGANCFDSKMYRNVVEFTLASETTLEIGIVGTFDLKQSWVIVGMFELFDLDDLASVSSPTDMTYAITNPGFEYRDLTGWTTENGSNSKTFWYMNNDALSGKAGIAWVETYEGGGIGTGRTIYQDLTGLDEGLYEVTVYGHLQQGAGSDGFYLYANGDKVAIGSTDKDYSVRTTVTDGNLRIKLTTESSNGNWAAFDKVRLQFYGDPLEAIKDLLVEAVDRAQALVDGNTIPDAAEEALQAVIDANDNDDNLFDEEDQFEDAIDAINDAYDTYKALESNYAAWLEVKAGANAMVAVDNNNETATSTLSSAITTQNTAAEAATTASGITTAINNLKTAIMDFVEDAVPTSGNRFDLTFLLTNPDLTGMPTWQKADGWFTDQSDGNSQVMQNDSKNNGTYTHFFEYWSASAKTDGYTLYLKTTLPKGVYSMECQAFAEDQREDAAKEANPTYDGVTFSANDVDGSKITSTTLDAASISFYQASESEVKLGLKAHTGNTRNWMGIGYVQLFKVANDQASGVYATVRSSANSALESGDYTNVTGKERTDLATLAAVETPADYVEAIEALQAANSAFVGAKETYDTWVSTTITKNTTNVGTGVFQLNETTNNTLYAAYLTARDHEITSSTTAATVEGWTEGVNTAISNYQNQELNAPAADNHYYVKVATTGHAKEGNAIVLDRVAEYPVYSDKYISNNTGFTLSASAAPAEYLAQVATFTQVSGNIYNISIEREEGTVYLTYGSLNDSKVDWKESQIQATTESSKKGEFKIVATTTANVFNIVNTTATGGTIACQTGGNIYTEAGNADFTLEEASQASVAMGIQAGKYATRIFPFTPSLPDGVVAYSCAAHNGALLTLVEVAKPQANVPYILLNTNGSEVKGSLTGWGTAKQDTYNEGYLTGVYTAASVEAGNYVLQTKGGVQGFYKVTGDALEAIPYRAYLTVPAEIKAFFFDVTDGINNLDANDNINKNEAIYNLAGQRVQKAQKGLYIVNGRKVVVK